MNLENSLVMDPSELPIFETKSLVGRLIVDAHSATDAELLVEGWNGCTDRPMVLVLDDGTKVYASVDQRGTSPGVLFLLVPEDTDTVRVWHKQRVGLITEQKK